MEEDRSSNATCSFLAQLWHTVGGKKMVRIPSTADQTEQGFGGDGFLTRAEWDQGGSRGFQEEGGGLRLLLDTGRHLVESKLV